MIATQKLLDKAATPTLERIRSDRERAPHQLRPLLDYLEQNLFDPDLDANQLKRACGVRDNSLPIQFHNVLDLPPYAYIEDCRLEVACRLLAESSLKVWQVAQILGYSTLQVFSRAFHRWAGIRPTAFRRQARAAASATETAVSEAPAPSQAKPVSPEKVAVEPTGESITAEEAWTLIQGRPLEKRRPLVRNRWFVASPELVDLLLEKSLEANRREPREAIGLVELAFDCLDVQASSLPEKEFRGLETKGWVRLGNSRRIANDFLGAEEAFGQAEARLTKLGRKPEIEAELAINKSWLRIFQRRLDEALELAGRAVEAGRSSEQVQMLARCLLTRADVCFHLNRVADGLPDVEESVRITDGLDNPYLRFSAHQQLATFLTKVGDYQRAAQAMPTVKELWQKVNLPNVLPNVVWTEGMIAEGLGHLDVAEGHYRAAYTGLLEAQKPYDAAVAALDLAGLYAQQGRSNECLELANELIPVLEGFGLHQEVLMALELLRRAISTERVTAITVSKIRSHLEKMELEPGA